MTSHSFPDPVFESLLEKLAQTLEVAQRADSTLDPQTRQLLYQTTTAFKDGMSKARDHANNLPGGELLIEEQFEMIAMLEKLRDQKREQLAKFSSRALESSSNISSGYTEDADVEMEIDSTASSPHD